MKNYTSKQNQQERETKDRFMRNKFEQFKKLRIFSRKRIEDPAHHPTRLEGHGRGK
jgi:hypothetical protein